MQEEKSDDRKQKLLQEMQNLFNGFPMSLDSKGREQFNSKYNALKNFIFDITVWTLPTT